MPERLKLAPIDSKPLPAMRVLSSLALTVNASAVTEERATLSEADPTVALTARSMSLSAMAPAIDRLTLPVVLVAAATPKLMACMSLWALAVTLALPGVVTVVAISSLVTSPRTVLSETAMAAAAEPLPRTPTTTPTPPDRAKMAVLSWAVTARPSSPEAGVAVRVSVPTFDSVARVSARILLMDTEPPSAKLAVAAAPAMVMVPMRASRVASIFKRPARSSELAAPPSSLARSLERLSSLLLAGEAPIMLTAIEAPTAAELLVGCVTPASATAPAMLPMSASSVAVTESRPWMSSTGPVPAPPSAGAAFNPVMVAETSLLIQLRVTEPVPAT